MFTYCGVCRRKLRDVFFCRYGKVCCSVSCYRWHVRDWHAVCPSDEHKESPGESPVKRAPAGRASHDKDSSRRLASRSWAKPQCLRRESFARHDACCSS
jgi:hypothetical protein